jgi:hypothetical protein
MQMMPIPMPFFAPSGSNGSGDPNASNASAAQRSVFSNPYNAPFLYSALSQDLQGQGQTQTGSSMGALGLNGNQMGLLMLATQRPMGIGSGQLSGARPGASSDPRQSRGKPTTQPASGAQRTTAGPGGLAARYFNRMGPRSPYPQSYYNRQNRYFP